MLIIKKSIFYYNTTIQSESIVRLRTRELFESERRKRELEESYETMKRYLDEALKEVSVWKKRRS